MIEEGTEGVLPAEIVRREGVAKGTTADSRGDVIRVVIEKEAVEAMKKDMGVFGVWVRVNENPVEEKEDRAAEGGEKKDAGEKKKKKKRGGKGKSDDSADKVFWYTETVFEVMPSFWTEAKGDEIVEGS